MRGREREREIGVRERKGGKGADHLGSWRGKLIHLIIVLHDCVVFLFTYLFHLILLQMTTYIVLKTQICPLKK